MRPDTVVIGAGLSGLVAAIRLAEAGASVLVLARGAGAVQLAPATIDVLGYAPHRVEDPLAAVEALSERSPEHPYALVGQTVVRESLEWLRASVARGPLAPYAYAGSPDENLLLATALGVPRPSALVPETMVAGDLRAGGPIAVVGLRMKDFHPALIADNLTRATLPGPLEARALEVDPPVGPGAGGAMSIARALDRPAGRKALASQLAGRLREGERVALPAVLGMGDPHGAWEDLERRVGHPVFEVPTLPPSIPGIRLLDTLRALLRRAGGRLIMGPEIARVERAGARAGALHVRVSGGERTYRPRWLVLATGGVASGGIHLGSDRVLRETVLDLPVAGQPAHGPRFAPDYFASQPLAHVGIAADHQLRPVGKDGEPLYENVLVVGATLAGAEPWKEKSGNGIALATGQRAADVVLASEGVAIGGAASR